MKKKIQGKMVLVSLVAIIATFASVALIFYGMLKEQVMDDLKAYVSILDKFDWEDMTRPESTSETFREEELRITVVSEEGRVLYDNYAPVDQMQNHADRPEIKQAMMTGEGKSIRKSETLSRDTYYYAVRLSDGDILRVSRESSNVFHIIFKSLFSLICIFLIIVCASVMVSKVLTESLVKPIQNMAKDIDHMDEVDGYDELKPFIQTINQQHLDIMKNANMRQEFTANVSHELKTPLTSISGYSELIENGMTNPEDTQRFAREIHRNAKRLLTLINDIIRLSELDSLSGDEKEFEKVNLYDLAQTCVEMLDVNASKHEVYLHLEGKAEYVTGSRTMLEELLYNLCDNAIRYNVKNGNVLVTVDDLNGRVFMSVEDSGIGISLENQERVFERFYRVDKSRSKQTGGTGLGLAIVKHIVSAHEADLSIESDVGKGTKITVVFKNEEKI